MTHGPIARTPSRRPGAAAAALACILAAGAALAACTPSPPSDTPGATGGSPSATGGPTPGGGTGTASASAAPTPSDPLGVPSAAQSLIAQDALVSHTCTSDAAGVWSFSGTLKNTSTDRRTYTVAIAVLNGPSVAGHSLQTATLDPGGSAEIRAEAIAVIAGQGGSSAQMRCDAVVSQEAAR